MLWEAWQILGMAIALWGGITLFMQDEREWKLRRRQARAIATGAARCALVARSKCWRCGIGGNPGTYCLECLALREGVTRAYLVPHDCIRCVALRHEENPPSDRWWLLHGHHRDFCGACRDALIEAGRPRLAAPVLFAGPPENHMRRPPL
jgi:hypothetical protein